MELLQKLTLYDLLGYTLPGSVLVMLIQYQFYGDEILYLEGASLFLAAAVLLIIGYLVGIVVSEIMRLIIDKLFGDRKEWEKICQDYKVSKEAIGRALCKAKMVENMNAVSDYEKTFPYKTQMYSDIQTDLKYNRIHNYASAELLYKNMIFVSAVCAGVGIAQTSPVLLFCGIIGFIFFGIRWKRFYTKKMGYMLCWFVEKYDRNERIDDRQA